MANNDDAYYETILRNTEEKNTKKVKKSNNIVVRLAKLSSRTIQSLRNKMKEHKLDGAYEKYNKYYGKMIRKANEAKTLQVAQSKGKEVPDEEIEKAALASDRYGSKVAKYAVKLVDVDIKTATKVTPAKADRKLRITARMKDKFTKVARALFLSRRQSSQTKKATKEYIADYVDKSLFNDEVVKNNIKMGSLKKLDVSDGNTEKLKGFIVKKDVDGFNSHLYPEHRDQKDEPIELEPSTTLSNKERNDQHREAFNKIRNLTVDKIVQQQKENKEKIDSAKTELEKALDAAETKKEKAISESENGNNFDFNKALSSVEKMGKERNTSKEGTEQTNAGFDYNAMLKATVGALNEHGKEQELEKSNVGDEKKTTTSSEEIKPVATNTDSKTDGDSVISKLESMKARGVIDSSVADQLVSEINTTQKQDVKADAKVTEEESVNNLSPISVGDKKETDANPVDNVINETEEPKRYTVRVKREKLSDGSYRYTQVKPTDAPSEPTIQVGESRKLDITPADIERIREEVNKEAKRTQEIEQQRAAAERETTEIIGKTEAVRKQVEMLKEFIAYKKELQKEIEKREQAKTRFEATLYRQGQAKDVYDRTIKEYNELSNQAETSGFGRKK